jgi:hypothetical protein
MNQPKGQPTMTTFRTAVRASDGRTVRVSDGVLPDGWQWAKPIRDVRPGDVTPAGWAFISEPAEQPDGSWSVMMRAPSGQRQVIDFDSGDASSDAPER